MFKILKVYGNWFVISTPCLAADKSDANIILILLFSNMFLELKNKFKIRNFMILCIAVPVVSFGKQT